MLVGRSLRDLRSWLKLFSFTERLGLSANDRIMVIAPHCDDETLGAGGLTVLARRLGIAVRVVVVTNGDGFRYGVSGQYRRLRPRPETYIRYALRRQQETINALAILGVDAAAVSFLGYPDRGIAHLWSPHWEPDHPYASVFTRRSRCPYPNARTPNAAYCGRSLLNDLCGELADFEPTLVIGPHPHDAHPDHWATHAFIMSAVEEYARIREGLKPKVLCYLIHRGNWPLPKGPRLDAPLLPPRRLAEAQGHWLELPLPDWVVKHKHLAIRAHRSQVALMGRYLTSFARRNKLFAPSVPVPAAAVAREQATPVIGNPVGDTVLRRWQGRANIRGLHARYDGERLWLRLALRSAPSRIVSYMVYVGSLDESQRRLQVSVSRNWSQALVKDVATGQSFTIHIQREPQGWILPLPVRLLDRPQRVMISAETRIGRLQIDRSAWAMVQLVPEPNIA